MPTPNIPPPHLDDELGVYWVDDKLRDAYWLSLGTFVDTYGGTEGALTRYLTRFIARNLGEESDADMKFSRALVGSQRAGELTGAIKRVMRVSGSDQKAITAANFALDHLGEIHSIRDRLVHQGASPEFYEGRWVVRNSNHNQIREEDQHEEIWFAIEDLDKMTEDLWGIRVTVRFAMFPNLIEIEPDVMFDELVRVPWQYTPSSLIRVRRTKPNQKTKRKRPPQSSEA